MEREVQIANWEKDLANIIKKTNSNIQNMSETTRVNGLARKNGKVLHPLNSKSNLPIPPPTSPLSPYKDDYFADNNVASQSTSHASTNHYKKVAKEVYHSSRGTGVTRPLPTHVEDDLTTRIGYSIRKSIERATNEKNLKSQIRLDGVRDQVDSLHTEMERVNKVSGNLSRSVSSHERVTKWLRKEAACQKDVLEKIQNMRVEDEEWKDTIQTKLDVLRQQICKDKETSATNLQLKAAMTSAQRDSKLVIDDAVAFVRAGVNSEMMTLRADLNSLRNENATIKETLRATQEAHKSLVATLDNGCIRDIVSSAVQPQILNLEKWVTSTIQPRFEAEIRKLHDTIESKIEQKQKYFWNGDRIQQDTETFNILSDVMLRALKENKDEFTSDISKRILTQMLDTTKTSNCDHEKLREKLMMLFNQNQDKHIKSTIEMQLKQIMSHGLEEVETKLTQRIVQEVEDLKRGKCAELNKAQDQITNFAVTHAWSRIDEKLKDILPGNITDIIEPKLACFKEKLIKKCSIQQKEYRDIQKIYVLEKKLHSMSNKIDEFRHDNNNNKENRTDNTQLSLENLKSEISTIKNTSDVKCEAIGEEIRQMCNSALEHANTSWKKELIDLNAKLQITHSLCQTLRSSMEVSKQSGMRMETVKNENKLSITSEEYNIESDLAKQINATQCMSDDNKKEIRSINLRLIAFETDNKYKLSARPEEELLKCDLSNTINVMKDMIKEDIADIKSNNNRVEETLMTKFNVLQKENEINNVSRTMISRHNNKIEGVSQSVTNMKFTIDINSKDIQKKIDGIVSNVDKFQSDIINAQKCIKKLEIFAAGDRTLTSFVEEFPSLNESQVDNTKKLRNEFSGLQTSVNQTLEGNIYDSINAKKISTPLHQVKDGPNSVRHNIDDQSNGIEQKIINNEHDSKRTTSPSELSKDIANKSEEIDVSVYKVKCLHDSSTLAVQRSSLVVADTIHQNETCQIAVEQVSPFTNFKDNILSVQRNINHLKGNNLTVGVGTRKENCDSKAKNEIRIDEHLNNLKGSTDALITENLTSSEKCCDLIINGTETDLEIMDNNNRSLIEVEIAQTALDDNTTSYSAEIELSEDGVSLIEERMDEDRFPSNFILNCRKDKDECLESTFATHEENGYDSSPSIIKGMDIDMLQKDNRVLTSTYHVDTMEKSVDIHQKTVSRTSIDDNIDIFSQTVQNEESCEIKDGASNDTSNISDVFSLGTIGSGSLSGGMSYFDEEESVESLTKNNILTYQNGKPIFPENRLLTMKNRNGNVEKEEPKVVRTNKTEIDIMYNYEEPNSFDQLQPIDIEESLDSLSINNDSDSSISNHNACIQDESDVCNKSQESMYNSDFESEIEAGPKF